MICRLCQERGKTWEGSEPKCAFDNSFNIFNEDNWNCATMNMLREIGENNTIYHDDQNACLLRGVAHDHVVVSWYKNRGCTEQAYMINGDGVKDLSLEEAELIIKANENKEKD